MPAQPAQPAIPILHGQATPAVQQAITQLHGRVQAATKVVSDLAETVAKIPDPHGALVSAQVEQVRQNLLGAGNLLQQVNGFTQLPQPLPTTDPKQQFALWNDGGLVRVSAG